MLSDPLFLSILVVGPFLYWNLIPAERRSWFLAFVSIGYLALKAPGATAAVVFWTLAFFWAVPRARQASRPLRAVGGLIGLLLGYLVLFKHLPVIFDALASTELEAKVILPLGASYYVFKLVHYAVEVTRGSIEEHDAYDALAWTTLFPAFLAGPIERFDHFLANRHAQPSAAMFASGITRIVHGLIKKLVIADVFLLGLAGSVPEMLATLNQRSTPEVWWFLFLMYLWAYLDFSAYSDIAIGSARLFGIELMENFDWPVLAENIGQFWKRWHMTLAGWCQSYVYLPFVGLTRNPYAATYATFLVMGIWHGAAFNWLFWGLFHGTGVSIHLRWNRYKRKKKWHKWMNKGWWAWAGVLPTTLFVTAAAAFTTTVPQGGWAALRLFGKLFFIG